MLHRQDWNKVLDKKSGKFYYWNTVSGEVQWHKPFEMDMDELDDVDDLVRGTGIESQDYKILEASASKRRLGAQPSAHPLGGVTRLAAEIYALPKLRSSEEAYGTAAGSATSAAEALAAVRGIEADGKASGKASGKGGGGGSGAPPMGPGAPGHP
jgi:hypothetical protein